VRALVGGGLHGFERGTHLVGLGAQGYRAVHDRAHAAFGRILDLAGHVRQVDAAIDLPLVIEIGQQEIAAVLLVQQFGQPVDARHQRVDLGAVGALLDRRRLEFGLGDGVDGFDGPDERARQRAGHEPGRADGHEHNASGEGQHAIACERTLRSHREGGKTQKNDHQRQKRDGNQLLCNGQALHAPVPDPRRPAGRPRPPPTRLSEDG
jgi:hypothetical protein